MVTNTDPFFALEGLFQFLGVKESELLECRVKFLSYFQVTTKTFSGRFNEILNASPAEQAVLREETWPRIQRIRNLLYAAGDRLPLINALIYYNGMFELPASPMLAGCLLAAQNSEGFEPVNWVINQICRVVQPSGPLADMVISFARSLVSCRGSIDDFYYQNVFEFAREFAGKGKLAQNPVYHDINLYTFAWAVMGQEDSALPVVARWVYYKTKRKVKDWSDVGETVWDLRTLDSRRVALMDIIIEIVNHELTYLADGQQVKSFFVESF